MKFFRNKVRGGRRAKDGRRYEIAYGVSLAIAETAKLVEALRLGTAPEHLMDYFFDEEPVALLDDFYLCGYNEEFYAQLKSGDFTLPEVLPAFKLQGKIDDAIGCSPNYKLIHGRYNMSQASISQIESHPRTTQEIFQFSSVYMDHAALNDHVYYALTGLTGCIDMQIQDEAYSAFFYEYWVLEGAAPFAHFLDAAAKRCNHIRRFEIDDTLEALCAEIERCCPASSASIVGQILRISSDGILQGFKLPSDEAFDAIIKWLDVRDNLPFRQVIAGLEKCGWRRPTQ